MKVTFKTGLYSVCFNNEQKRIDRKTLNSVILTYFNILQTQVSRYKCLLKIWPIPQQKNAFEIRTILYFN